MRNYRSYFSLPSEHLTFDNVMHTVNASYLCPDLTQASLDQKQGFSLEIYVLGRQRWQELEPNLSFTTYQMNDLLQDMTYQGQQYKYLKKKRKKKTCLKIVTMTCGFFSCSSLSFSLFLLVTLQFMQRKLYLLSGSRNDVSGLLGNFVFMVPFFHKSKLTTNYIL